MNIDKYYAVWQLLSLSPKVHVAVSYPAFKRSKAQMHDDALSLGQRLEKHRELYVDLCTKEMKNLGTVYLSLLPCSPEFCSLVSIVDCPEDLIRIARLVNNTANGAV